ncbi:hypothetical protein FO519_007668 [Halicephalobus sp. NKZ332]|nr:hypothetical protein FO519_007668 [Halicephalobus sp. NKZ332]
MTNIETAKSCMALGDINGDGESKLVLVDFAKNQCRLKLLKGLTLITDAFLPDEPAGVVAFMEENGHLPSIAVAIGSSLLIYRNMKPYYRCNVESMDLDPSEVQLWKAAKEGQIGAEQLFEELQLTNTLITCVSTIKKNSTESSAPDVLLIGTESGSIYWIDTTAFNVVGHCRILDRIPEMILTMGEFELESRYMIALRDGDLAVLKRNQENKFSKTIINIRSFPLAMAKSKTNVVIATKSRKLIFFSTKMQKTSEIQFEEDIVDLETFYYEPRLYSGVFVAFKEKINLYIDGSLMDSLKSENVDWIKFGKFGREEAVLIIGHLYEGITVMNFRRTAVLFEINQNVGPPTAQFNKLRLPKKSKTFVDLSMRERQDPQKIHTTYQRDLFMLRLQIARSFAELTTTNSGMLPSRESEKMEISCEIHGFGPQFRINIRLIASGEVMDEKRWIGFTFDKREYQMQKELIPLAKIVPRVPWIYSNSVTCLHPEKGLQSEVKVVILSEKKRAPLWMTKFEMPVSEQNIV